VKPILITHHKSRRLGPKFIPSTGLSDGLLSMISTARLETTVLGEKRSVGVLHPESKARCQM
jgi:hypothetical protein